MSQEGKGAIGDVFPVAHFDTLALKVFHQIVAASLIDDFIPRGVEQVDFVFLPGNPP